MCKITKIIAGLLCAAIAGIGVLAISGNQAGIAHAEDQTITSTTPASSSMSIAQLQQIINLLKQQIQQIIVLMRQRVIQSPICGNGKCETGETAATCPQDCSTAAATCAEVCKGKGYADGACTSWAVTAVTGGCGAGQLNMGWTSDCSDPQTTGGGRACCCYNAAADCAKEGEIKYPDWTGNENKPHECCAGLTAIVNCTESGAAPNNGTAICAYCGNGVCGKGENKTNCPADCGTTTCAKEGEKIASSQTLQCCAGLNKIPNCAESGECASGAVCAYCGNGVCGTGENKTNCPADCGTTTCAKEGERIMPGDGKSCCSGLSKMPFTKGDGTTCTIPSGYICTAFCGDGICGSPYDCSDETDCAGASYENACSCPKDCGTAACAKEGEKISSSQTTQCCAGLTKISNCTASGECASGAVCAYCGNGLCGKGENKTNCPKDCATAATCRQDGKCCCLGAGGGDCRCFTGYENGKSVCASGLVATMTGCDSSCKPSFRCGACVQEGDISYWNGAPCCEGLERQTITQETNDGRCSAATVAGEKCTSAKCGNGTCESEKGENRCNCSADCESKSGGNCVYKNYKGICSVTAITDATSGATVTFKFTPSRTMDLSGTFLTSQEAVTGRSYSEFASYLGLECAGSTYPLTSAKLKSLCEMDNTAGFDCEMKIITSGTCTPTIFDFGVFIGNRSAD